MAEKDFIVIRTHVMSDLTLEQAYLLAMRLRSQGYGSEILTLEEWKEQNRGTMQDLTPFERQLGLRQETPREE